MDDTQKPFGEMSIPKVVVDGGAVNPAQVVDSSKKKNSLQAAKAAAAEAVEAAHTARAAQVEAAQSASAAWAAQGETAELAKVVKSDRAEVLQSALSAQAARGAAEQSASAALASQLDAAQSALSARAAQTEIARSEAEYDVKYAVLKNDRTEVRQEIRSIENCRTLVFLGTFAAIGTIFMTTAAIVAQDVRHYRAAATATSSVVASGITGWMFWGSMAALGFLTIGVLATVLKVRQINVRRAFLIAIEEYAVVGIIPPGYMGWERHSMLYFESKALKGAVEWATDGKAKLKDYQSEANETAKSVNCKKKLIAGFTSSFTALSSISYIATFGAVILLLFTSAVVELIERHGEPLQVYGALICGGGVGILAFFATSLILYIIPKRKGKNWVDKILGVATLLLLLWLGVAACVFFTHVVDARKDVYPFLTLGPLAAVVAFLSCYLWSQFVFCRKGKYSPEKYFFMWDAILKDPAVPFADLVGKLRAKASEAEIP